MATGIVTSYHEGHGYGSIKPDDGGPEVIVYYDSVTSDAGRVPVTGPGGRGLAVGQKVSYEPAKEEGRIVAEHVRLL
ncbi:cold-shock protein [Kitasatospora sp. NPDC057223]|uniref:cold-shock protein n=1 Tax=Kitasatospora sp. NPDC057223 TaxID=3346055 RepID=UPI0036310E93